MNQLKKIVSIVMACLFIFMQPLQVLAEDSCNENTTADDVMKTADTVEYSGSCGENLSWMLDGEGTLTISGEGEMEDYSSSSRAPWYLVNEDIIQAIIEEGVTSIGNEAFAGCEYLSDIMLPEGITSIGTNAFFGCQNLNSVILPESITKISDWAFQDCSNLSGVTIPKNVADIGDQAFASCKRLMYINVDSENLYYSSINGVLFDKEQSTLIAFPAGVSSSYIIPEGVVSIGDYAFQYCSNLTSVTIPKGVISIGKSAFDYCEKLTSITISDSVTSIGDNAFYFCRNLSSITIPESVNSIGRAVFTFCDNLYINVEEGNTSYSSLDGVLFNKAQTALIAFTKGTAAAYVIPDGVTTICSSAFSSCENLTSLTIPASIIKIEESALSTCYNLAYVYYSGTESQWNNMEIGYYNHYLTNATIYYNSTDIEEISSGVCGDNLIWVLDSKGTLTVSGTGEMYNYSSASEQPWYSNSDIILQVIIGSGVTSIGDYTFYSCDNLSDVEISNTVASIGHRAFGYCLSLNNVEISEGITCIGMDAFGLCSQLTSIELPEGVQTIEMIAFQNCTGMTSIVIPDSVVSIEQAAFFGCNSLVDVYYLGDQNQWEKTTIGESNECLTNATIHYNSTGNENEDIVDGKTTSNVVFFKEWDADNQIAYFDSDPSENPANLGCQVTEETDTSFLEKVDELVGTYVLAETKIRDDGMLLPDTLISILPVETKSGTVTANSGLTISIDGVEYAITERLGLVLYDAGDMVTYHLYNGELVGIRDYDPDAVNPELPDDPDPEDPDVPEDEYHMVVYPYGNLTIEVGETLELTCSLYNGGAQMAVWEQPQLSISHKEDTAPVSYEGWKEHQAGSYVLSVKGISAGTAYLTIHDTVTGDVVKITVEVVPMQTDSIRYLSIKYKDDLEKKEKTATVNWGYSLFHEDARNIENSDPTSFAELVKFSALLSNASYDLSDGGYLQQTLNQLGAENIEIMNSGKLDISYPAHSISHVEFYQGDLQQNIIIVTIRGSKTIGDWFTDIAGSWAYELGEAPKEHPGFALAKTRIKNEIMTYLSTNSITASESKILITGHSYGGAVANLLANSLEDVFDQSDIYAYTFASPNTIVVTSSLVLGSNIHNFRNAWDVVVRVPVALLPIEKYTVFGQQHFFTLEEIGDDSEGVLFWKNHNCTHYVNYAFGLVEHNPIDALQTRCVQIHCPVDVTAYDENGNVVGKITGNQLDESSTTIMMYPVSDQKNIFIDQNEDVQLSIVATDTGTMDVIITEYDVVTGNVSAIKEYSSIGLIEGKDFYTNISNETVTADIELEVVDNEGNRLAIVNEDGTETVDISENHKHATEIQNTKDATCTKTGYSGDEVCSECGTVVKKGYEISTISHDYKAVVTNPTCTADGYTTYACSVCGDTYTGDPVTKLGHYMSKPTCTEAAMCQREDCDYTEGSAFDHSFTNYVSNDDATCIADGTKTATCDRCNKTDTLADVGSAKGHNYVDATCTEPKICKICGTTDGEVLGHKYATAWSKGVDGHWHECAACEDKTDFTAHDYGIEGGTCLICEYEYVHVHELTLVPSVDATCTTSGNVAYYTCSGCENWFEDAFGTSVIADKPTVIISALGHDMAKSNCLDAARCQRQNCDYTEGTAQGHVDENADKRCDRCSISLETEQPGDANGPSVDNPQTGDNRSLELWITLLILSFVCAIICIRCGKNGNVA